MIQSRYYLLSLGCAKNTVDSESMAQLLSREGYVGVSEPNQAEVLIVNTCGFIDLARQESLHALRKLAQSKRPGQLLIAAGCLAQFWGARLTHEVPGLDGVVGTRRWMDVVEVVERTRERRHPEPLYHLPDEALTVGKDERGTLRAAIQGPSAYLKIADGCRRPCAFCSIPLIKGGAVSRPPETILSQARQLADMGIRELIVIAQDTTDYGHDLGMKDGLAQLLEQIVATAPEIDWVRVMYAYPGCVTPRLMEVMARHDQILPYLDIPLQHAHPATLRRMRRPANVDWVYRTIAALRRAMPGIAIRSTFITGYPGETEQEFQALLDFVAEVAFDRVGAFSYSYEPGTPSADLGDPVTEEIKVARRDRLMALQQEISLGRNQALVGQTLDVLVEGQGDGLSVGRSYRDAPEIDGLVLIDGHVAPGEIVPARITGALEYDLSGVVETGRARRAA
ncbi:MAG: 30S ribosomal protein S12 methylthiotransferase RimO [Anaerolineae bacterium]|jgi:ribosomal protein S12 methylthiotransferase